MLCLTEFSFFVLSYKVLEQILGVLIKFVKDLKLQHQHEFVSMLAYLVLAIVLFKIDVYAHLLLFTEFYNIMVTTFICYSYMEQDKLRKTWLCKRCQTMNAKLRFVYIYVYLTNQTHACLFLQFIFLCLRNIRVIHDRYRLFP